MYHNLRLINFYSLKLTNDDKYINANDFWEFWVTRPKNMQPGNMRSCGVLFKRGVPAWTVNTVQCTYLLKSANLQMPNVFTGLWLLYNIQDGIHCIPPMCIFLCLRHFFLFNIFAMQRNFAYWRNQRMYFSGLKQASAELLKNWLHARLFFKHRLLPDCDQAEQVYFKLPCIIYCVVSVK